MIPKRVKQFYMNTTDNMNDMDVLYVKENLEEYEQAMFFKLLKSEQKHCVRIARDIEYIIDNNKINNINIIKNKELLIKAALLHDVGKCRKKLNVFDKSIIVIMNKMTKGKLRKIKFSSKVQCYYNHSEYSYEILKDIVDNKELLNIIRYHHSATSDELIIFFKRIDDLN